MKPGEVIPPPLPPAVAAVCDRPVGNGRRTQSVATGAARPLRQSLQSLALLVGLMLLARMALHFQFPLPSCPLRELTGVPCPLCGSTRTFAALARLDFAAALRLNPLVCVAACGATALWLLAMLRTEKPLAWLRSLLVRGAMWKWLLAVALALNWLYLWLPLPR